MAKKEKEKQPDILLSEGILLSGGFYEQREKKWTGWLVRALFLFAIVTGSLGGMLSAFDISYEKWAFFLSALLASLYCASLYVNVWWENIGYILIFVLILNAGLGLQTYISSGFYGILNDISSAAMVFFGSTAQISYAEQVADHRLAVSVAMCYFALIGCIFTNGLISRKMRYFAAAVPAVFFLLIPLYLEREPSAGYVILLLSGIVTVYMLRQNRYTFQPPKAKTIQKAAKKHLYAGNFSGSSALLLFLSAALLCSGIVAAAGLFFLPDAFTEGSKKSAFKLRTMDRMENLYLLGIMGLMNFYPTTGGLVNGRLGGVNSVRLDYETDLTLTFVPYTYDRIYLKTFVGAEYIPYENHWSTQNGLIRTEGFCTDTADRLENAFLSGSPGYAKGIMKIRNTAAMTGVYLPYYSKDTEKTIAPGREQAYTFYPLLTETLTDEAGTLQNGIWLEIPEENQETVAAFCKEAGLSGSAQEITDRLGAYFQEHFPYTLNPGITPRKRDFVNDFLAEKRKGYCAHYASSAVLILRYMGIPARYVEGYAVDAVEIATDARLTEENVSDYYQGTSLLSQASVVSFDVSDEDAHAWVEMYDEKTGWYPVEFTPYSTEQESRQDSLWDMFLKLFQTEEDTAPADRSGQTDIPLIGNTGLSVDRLVFSFMVLLLTAPVVLFTQKGMRIYRYLRAGRNERLLIRYRNRFHRTYGKKRPDSGTVPMKNFEEQVWWLSEQKILTADAASLECLIRTLNEAAFSKKEISADAFASACRLLGGFRKDPGQNIF